ncbi:MAG: hypothetical protein ACOC6F_00100 [bacterium]
MHRANPEKKLSSMHRTVHIDLHGVVGIRLVNPTDRDLAGLTKQIAFSQATLGREPDITIRFERQLLPSALNYLGVNSAAFTEQDFFILDRRSGQLAAQIPFDEIGQPCEIVCQSDLGFVPLLTDIVRLAFLRKGYVSLHGAAFLYNGKGILVAGWSKGGKTETLMSFANHGAHYLADEWVLLPGDGRKMLGLPIPITLWDWQLEQVTPSSLPSMSREKKIIFKGIHALQALQRMFDRIRLDSLFPVRALDRLLPVLSPALNVRESPHTLFKDRCYQQGTTIDRLFLVISHSEPQVVVDPCDSTEIAQRMAHSNEFEEEPINRHYRAYRFAFPHRRNLWLERAPEFRSSLLFRALEGKEAYQVFHPYPVSFEELFSHLQPLC